MALEITDKDFEEVVLKSTNQYWLTFGQLGVDHVEWLDLLLMK